MNKQTKIVYIVRENKLGIFTQSDNKVYIAFLKKKNQQQINEPTILVLIGSKNPRKQNLEFVVGSGEQLMYFLYVARFDTYATCRCSWDTRMAY